MKTPSRAQTDERDIQEGKRTCGRPLTAQQKAAVRKGKRVIRQMKKLKDLYKSMKSN